MIPVEPVFEQIVQGAESCPVCSARENQHAKESITLFRWFRFPRLRRQKGLATGIIGLW
jgi:hypothetical protein